MTQPLAIPQNNRSMPQSGDSTDSHPWRDWAGVGASIACAIHCAAMPFVVGSLPLIGLSFLADPSFHKWMVGICLGIALFAFFPGWRRHHRFTPAIIGLVGLSLISVAAFAGPEDCCATSSCAATSPDAPKAKQLVAIEEETCATSCCATEIAVESDTEKPATIASFQPEVLNTRTVCSADNTTMTAGSAAYTRFLWTWITPLGGVFLVIGHLCNRNLSCQCTTGCGTRIERGSITA